MRLLEDFWSLCVSEGLRCRSEACIVLHPWSPVACVNVERKIKVGAA